MADHAGSSFRGRGLPVGADFGWISRGSRCSVEHECTPSTDTYDFMVVVMAAAQPGSQDASGFRARSPRYRRSSLQVAFMGCHRGGQFCQYQGQYGSSYSFPSTQWWNYR